MFPLVKWSVWLSVLQSVLSVIAGCAEAHGTGSLLTNVTSRSSTIKLIGHGPFFGPFFQDARPPFLTDEAT
jgi:hypothetical protein